jgi:predicted transcriptional regulator
MVDSDSDDGGSEDLVITMTRRGDVMSELAEGRKRKREIASSISISRSTVHRSLQQLQELGLVDETGDGYALTGYGRTAFEAHQDFLAQASRFQESRELLQAIPREYAFPSQVFEDVDVVQPEPFALNRPVNSLEEVLDAARGITWLAPIITVRLLDVLEKRVTGRALGGRVILTEEVVGKLHGERPGTLASLCDAEEVPLEQTGSPVPFGLLLVEDEEPTLCVVVHDDAAVRGLLRTEREEAIDWSRDQLAQLDSRPVADVGDARRAVEGAERG